MKEEHANDSVLILRIYVGILLIPETMLAIISADAALNIILLCIWAFLAWAAVEGVARKTSWGDYAFIGGCCMKGVLLFTLIKPSFSTHILMTSIVLLASALILVVAILQEYGVIKSSRISKIIAEK